MQPYYPSDVYTARVDEQAVNAYVAKVFGWMFVGLMVTCLTTLLLMYGIYVSGAIAAMMGSIMQLIMIAFVVEFALVWALSARVEKMNPTTAKVLYLIYAALNGLTFGLVAVLYAGSWYTLGMAFGITAVSFGAMAAYGLITKADISQFGGLLRMGLIGLIIVMVVNWFLGSAALDYLICIVGLGLFLGITAHRTNMIKNHFAQVALAQPEGQQALASNLAIVGALMLYLAFINIFMFILRLLGSRR